MRDLSGKVAVITGGASGIGRALADAFADEGMKLVLADVEKPALEAAVAELEAGGSEAFGVPTDVRDPEQVRALADAALDRFGTVHVVCNNAGVAPLGPVLETSFEDWRWLVDVNLLGVAYGCSVFAPILIEQGEGHIVNTASAGGLIAAPGLGAYVATKHAVVGLSETLFLELADTGVGLSVLCPGLVDTRIFQSERNRPGDDGGPASYGDFQSRACDMLSRLGTPPARIARSVVEAIHEELLFILPNEEVKPLVLERFERVVAGENPSRDQVHGIGDA
ncbi:MAG: SDR family NAD(P)-dependent oxidoreductase [Myxococcota bacterium]|nr:SDR family NAD(P)-dependent oxidoreductase [Myxococcota bacterium]